MCKRCSKTLNGSKPLAGDEGGLDKEMAWAQARAAWANGNITDTRILKRIILPLYGDKHQCENLDVQHHPV